MTSHRWPGGLLGGRAWLASVGWTDSEAAPGGAGTPAEGLTTGGTAPMAGSKLPGDSNTLAAGVMIIERAER